VIASVSEYSAFLPFVLAARVAEDDVSGGGSDGDHAGVTLRARLRVGYAAMGIEEDWVSRVRVDEGAGLVEAKSGGDADAGVDGTGNGDGETQQGSLFEVLRTKWQLSDVEDIRGQGIDGVGNKTSVRLDVDVKFRSALYDGLFAGVEKEVAGMMVKAFERRIKELAGH
jgi:coenzyme Q-binding protein COQ10